MRYYNFNSIEFNKLMNEGDLGALEYIKETILENVNPRKWVCVGVEKEDVIIKNKGDLIVVIIVEDETNREKIANSFDNL